jgi:DNA repair protein RecO (recombination protein O)
MARTLKTEAIVFKKKSVLNRDMVVTLFTEERGKIKLYAKGMKKITSRRLPHNETGNLIKTVINKRGDNYYLQETQLISLFSQIKKDKIKLNYLYFFLFVLDRLLPENQKEPPVYTTLKKFLIDLSRSKNFQIDQVTAYLNIFLQQLGYTMETLSLAEALARIEEIINESIPFTLF